MSLKLYADTPTRRTRQVVADLCAVAWAALWIWLAMRLHDLILPLAGPGAQVESVGQDLAGSMSAAGSWLSQLPLVGDGASTPFDQASRAGQMLAEAGRSTQSIVQTLSVFLPVCLAVLAISMMLLVWLPLRIRFALRAGAAQRYLDTTGNPDLFALRALSRQPLKALLAIHDDPAEAWRRGDPRVIRELADLELRSEGVRARA